MSVTAATLPVNEVPCGGLNNIHDGCQKFFPYSDPSRTLCFKCVKLCAPDLAEHDLKAIEAYKFCSKCGVTGTRTVGPTTSAAELQAARSNRGAHWTLIYEVRVGSKIDKRFGQQTHAADTDETLIYALSQILETVNLKWVKIEGHYGDLLPKHCELGFKGNFRMAPEALTLTVKGLYQFYAVRNDRQMALGADNARVTGFAKGTYMQMEVIIDEDLYQKYINLILYPNMPPPTKASSSKRKKTDQDGQEPKRARTAVVLTSNFAPGVTYAVTVPEDFIKCSTITCVIDPLTGSAVLNETRSLKLGKIETSSLAGIKRGDLGKSKDVFKVKFT
ncbi:hypothetical protein DFH06DRAFT_1331261 [Mycena polygramma]|nr:hypothetical protein DFH06DRAFT_1331261 [Mycena polygramma]